jgi:hypothetical protein
MEAAVQVAAARVLLVEGVQGIEQGHGGTLLRETVRVNIYSPRRLQESVALE